MILKIWKYLEFLFPKISRKWIVSIEETSKSPPKKIDLQNFDSIYIQDSFEPLFVNEGIVH